MKTETLYQIKGVGIAADLAKSTMDFMVKERSVEPVEVCVGEYYVKKIPFQIKELRELCESGLMEKVTHVLPDQFRDDTKEINKLTLKLGELIYDKIGLQKKIEELGKELDSWKRIPANEGRVMRETIESQKRELESLQWEYQKKCGYADQSKEIDRLKAELAEVKKTWFQPFQYQMVTEANDGLLKRVSLLEKELEEAKKNQVKWVKNFCSENKVVEYEKYERKLSVFWDGMNCIIPKPQLRTLDDEAQEAYEKLSYEPRNSRMMFQEGFNAGFKSAKEIK